MAPTGTLQDRFSAKWDEAKAWFVPTKPEYDPSLGRKVYLVGAFTVHRWLFVDRCSTLASSLALQTLLSVVPIAGVILFFIHMLDPTVGRGFVAHVIATLSPEVAATHELADRVIDLGENVSINHLGLWGFLGVVTLAYFLFSTLERTMNQIWRVARPRKIWAKFTIFYTLSTLGPVIMVYSLAQPVLEDLTRWLLSPVITTTVGLVLINRLLPYHAVKWGAAVAGGILSASLFELGKFGFGQYLSMVALDTYEGLYGSGLALLPAFVVWAYLSWLIVLLGTELSFVLHHLPTIAKHGYVHPSVSTPEIHPAPGRAATRLLLAIADNYSHRDTSTSVEEIEQRYDIELGAIVTILENLERHGLVATLEDGGFVPARPLEQIRVAEVLALFDANDLDHARADALGDLFGELDASTNGRIGELTFAGLVAAEAERRKQTSSADRDERPRPRLLAESDEPRERA
jgi:YihY family inner membrane protein